MQTLTPREWDQLYRSIWRTPYAHLTKDERGRLVRICRGKAIFDNLEEARKMLRFLQPSGRLNLAAYTCPLCSGIHIGNRRRIAQHRLWLKIHPVDSEVCNVAITT